MRASRVGFAIVIGLALGTAVVVARSPLVGASVVSQCGQTVAGAPLPVVTKGSFPSNTAIHLFNERTDQVLPSALPVDISPTGVFPMPIDAVGELNPTNIASGTVVDSTFLYSDPASWPVDGQINYQATLTFSTPILGVIVENATLNATDAVVGAPGTTYAKLGDRGLELGSRPRAGDSVELVSPNAIHVNLNARFDIDSVRVITAGSTPGSFDGTAPHYTEVAADGGTFNFGSQFYGSMGGTHLNQPMVGGSGACGTPGYWMVASDGGIFSFGGAGFYGSTGSIHLNKPIVGMAATPDGLGYWLVASDGGIFAYGDASFLGSMGATPLNQPIVGAF